MTDELEGDIKRVVDKQGSLTDYDGDDEVGNDGGDDAVNCSLL